MLQRFKRALRNMTLGTQLKIWGTLLVIIPGICISTIFGYHEIQQTKGERIRASEQVAQIQRDTIDRWMTEQADDVRRMSVSHAARDRNIHDLDAELRAFLEAEEDFSAISFIDPHGKIVASTIKESIGSSVVDRDYFHKVMQGKQVISDVIFGRMTGQAYIVFAWPVYTYTGQLDGAIIASVRLNTLDTIMQQFRTGMTGEAYLVTNEGIMLTESRFLPELLAAGRVETTAKLEIKIDPTRVKSALMDGRSAGIYKGYRGKQVVGTYVSLQTQPWVVVSEIDEEEVLGPVHWQLGIVISSFMFVVLLSWPLTIMIARKIQAPVNELYRCAKAMQQGNYDVRAITDEASAEELVTLAATFNRMAATTSQHLSMMEDYIRLLNDQNQALSEAESKYRSLAEHSPLGVLVIQNNEMVYSNTRLAQLLAYTPQEFSAYRHFMDFVLPEDRTTVWYNLERKLNGETTISLYQIRGLRKDGSIIYAEIYSALCTYGGKPAVIGTVQDITERILAQEALQAAHNELEKRVEARTLELANTNRILQLTHDIAYQILQERPIGAILAHVCNKLTSELPLRFASVKSVDTDGSFSHLAVAGPALEFAHQACCNVSDVGQGTAGQALRTGRTSMLHIDDPEFASWRSQAEMYGINVVISVPLEFHGRILGVISFGAQHPSIFSSDFISQLEKFAGHVAIAMNAGQSKERVLLLTTALESAANAIVITDSKSRIQWVNKSFTEVSGYMPEEIIGQSTALLESSRHDRSFYDQLYQQIRSGRLWTGEVYSPCKDGGERIEHITITPLLNENQEITHFITIKQDIAERKKAEEILRRYQSLAKQAKDIIFMIDEDGRIIEANSAAEQAYGYTKQELCSLQISAIRSSGAPFAIHDLMKNADQDSGLYETVHCRKDGRTFPVEVSAIRHMYNDQHVILTIVRDLTERKQAEKEMMAAREQVAFAERLASLGTMAAGIAHEINQPLNSIKVTADSLLYWHKKGRDWDCSAAMDDIASISIQAGRIDKIIRHMRAMVNNDNTPQKHVVNLNAAIHGALELTSNQLLNHGVHVDADVDPALPSILGDMTQLEGVIVNLLVNAMQSLTQAEIADKRIVIKTFTDEKIVVLEVADNGIGIPAEIKERIFDPFFTTKSVGEGMGLGLSIVHSIITLYDGVIRVQNGSSGGVTFRIEFPSI